MLWDFKVCLIELAVKFVNSIRKLQRISSHNNNNKENEIYFHFIWNVEITDMTPFKVSAYKMFANICLGGHRRSYKETDLNSARTYGPKASYKQHDVLQQ